MTESPFNQVFIPASFFLLRTPIWSIEKLRDIMVCENWVEALIHLYESNELLREAISLASPSLCQSLKKKPLKDPQQTAFSLFNYFLRMTTRATPFGLFSWIAMGGWGPKLEVAFDSTKLYKRARPDMEWIYSLIQKIYQDKTLSSSLSILTNPLIHFRGDRFFIKYIRGKEKRENSKTTSISATPLVKIILQEAKELITISTLLEKLQISIPTLDYERAQKVIQELLSTQFLLPGILPSLLSPSPFEDLLPYLPPSLGINTIAQKIRVYNQCPPGQGEAQLAEVSKQMEAIMPAKAYLQLDTAHSGVPLRLPPTIGNEITKTAHFLWKISASQVQFSHLLEYHSKFVEKYGTCRTIPLLELLDEEKGLGLFINPHVPVSTKFSTKFTQEWEHWLQCAWQECLYEKKQEILLDEKLIDRLLSLAKQKHPNPQDAPPSFDLFCKIIANSVEEIESGQFFLLTSQSSWQGGSIFGRFIDLLSQDAQQQIYEFHQQEELLDKNSLFVELSYFPPSARNANVAIHPCLRKYRLDIESKKQETHSIFLRDICRSNIG